MRINFTTLLIITPLVVSAQTFDDYVKEHQQSFDEYRDAIEQSFQEYRNIVNSEFAESMRQSWSEVELQPAQVKPNIPEPPMPIFVADDFEITNIPLPVGDVIEPLKLRLTTPPKPIEIPKTQIDIPKSPIVVDRSDEKPISPQKIEPVAKPTKKGFEFTHYGTLCSVDIGKPKLFRLKGINESDVADVWSLLSTSKEYDNMVYECVRYRDQVQLCDWAYFTYVRSLCNEFCRDSDESIVLQMYILTQSGYRVRIARCDENLCLLLPFTSQVYDVPYLNIDGEKLYVMTKVNAGGSYAIFNQKFPNEQPLSLHIDKEPQFSNDLSNLRELKSTLYPSAVAKVSVNRNLVNFYGDYPRSDDMSIYVKSSLSSDVKQMLYPMIQSNIVGKSEVEAANLILNFVQTSLEYQTDDLQFGTERPLFGDETLYYPYSDCEDRAILFSILMKEIMGLDVVLLDYPNHIATAVGFNGDIDGDYVKINNRRYVICDPTYVGAKVGCAMPEYKSVKASVVML